MPSYFDGGFGYAYITLGRGTNGVGSSSSASTNHGPITADYGLIPDFASVPQGFIRPQIFTEKSSAFSPIHVTGCVLWLNPDDATTVTSSGGLISQITDKSGSSNTASQVTGTKQPGISVDVFTGRNKFAFDGGDVLEILDSASLDITAGISIFIALPNVVAWNGGAGFGYLLSKDGTTGTSAYGIYTNGPNTALRGNVKGSEAEIYTGAIPTGRHQTSLIYDQSNMYGRWDRTATGSPAVTGEITTNAVNLYIGAARSIGDFSYTGDMGEVLIYNRAVTDTERDQIETYLYDRWMVAQWAPRSFKRYTGATWVDATVKLRGPGPDGDIWNTVTAKRRT